MAKTMAYRNKAAKMKSAAKKKRAVINIENNEKSKRYGIMATAKIMAAAAKSIE
jgi:hypothetical protein